MTSLVAGVLLLAAVTLTALAPAVVATVVVVTPVVARLALAVRRRRLRATARTVARAAALRAEPLLPAALQR